MPAVKPFESECQLSVARSSSAIRTDCGCELTIRCRGHSPVTLIEGETAGRMKSVYLDIVGGSTRVFCSLELLYLLTGGGVLVRESSTKFVLIRMFGTCN